MAEPILKFRVPRPEDPELLRQYLELGWYELEGPDGPLLAWSFARGSPVHPWTQQRPEVPAGPVMEVLGLDDWHLESAAYDNGLPLSYRTGMTDCIVELKLRVRFRKEGKGKSARWTVLDKQVLVPQA